MRRFGGLVEHLLLYYDVQVYRLTMRPIDSGRLMGVVYLLSHATEPSVNPTERRAKARQMIELLEFVRHTLVRDRPRSVRDEAQALAAKTWQNLAVFVEKEESGENLSQIMQQLSSPYHEALLDADGPVPEASKVVDVAGEGVSGALGAWHNLRRLGERTERKERELALVAPPLFEAALHVSPGVRQYLQDVEAKARASLGGNATSGRYPVPPGTTCALCSQPTPANGSVGNDSERLYLCMMHLREVTQRS